MRLGAYEITPEKRCWKVAQIKTWGPGSKHAGEEYEAHAWYPGTFEQALALVLDENLKGEFPLEGLDKAVATVAYLYTEIKREVSREEEEG